MKYLRNKNEKVDYFYKKKNHRTSFFHNRKILPKEKKKEVQSKRYPRTICRILCTSSSTLDGDIRPRSVDTFHFEGKKTWRKLTRLSNISRAPTFHPIKRRRGYVLVIILSDIHPPSNTWGACKTLPFPSQGGLLCKRLR